MLFLDQVYEIAGNFETAAESADDGIDRNYEESDKGLGNKVVQVIGKVINESEGRGLTRTLDSKARAACRDSIDFSKIKSPQKQPKISKKSPPILKALFIPKLFTF